MVGDAIRGTGDVICCGHGSDVRTYDRRDTSDLTGNADIRGVNNRSCCEVCITGSTDTGFTKIYTTVGRGEIDVAGRYIGNRLKSANPRTRTGCGWRQGQIRKFIIADTDRRENDGSLGTFTGVDVPVL